MTQIGNPCCFSGIDDDDDNFHIVVKKTTVYEQLYMINWAVFG